MMTLLVSCRSVPHRACSPASELATWVEIHRPLSDSTSAPSIQLRLVADTASSRPLADQQLSLIIVRTDSLQRTPWRRLLLLTAASPAALQLPEGQYEITLRGITYETIRRTVALRSGYQVAIEVQPRQAEYCLDEAIEMRDASTSRRPNEALQPTSIF